MLNCPCGHGWHLHDAEAVPALCLSCGHADRCRLSSDEDRADEGAAPSDLQPAPTLGEGEGVRLTDDELRRIVRHMSPMAPGHALVDLQHDVERILAARLAEARTWETRAVANAEEGVRYLSRAERAEAEAAREKARADALATKVDRLTEISVEISQERDRLTEQVAKAGTKALMDAADEMEFVIAEGDSAEVCAPVSGEVGRSAVVARRDALYEEPHTWLRDRARGLDGAS